MTTRSPGGRLPAIDWLRGLVMMLMTVDHASEAINAGRLFADGAFLFHPGTPLPPAQFLTRWMTHLCAPTFVFLAGTALAMSVEKQLARGVPAREIDRFIAVRGVICLALEPLWMSWMFTPGTIFLQVMYALGGSFVAMTLLRRLPRRWLLVSAVALLASGELVSRATTSGGTSSLLAALLFDAGSFPPLLVAYPLVPWLAIMMVGWWFGGALTRNEPERIERGLVVGGVVALAAFGVLRGMNGYGNMGLYRESGALVQWLHVSKYPPSITYVTLELGIMALLLAGFFRVQRAFPDRPPRWTGPLLVFGQTAFFYYLLHGHLLKLGAWLLGVLHRGTLAETWGAAVVVLVLLYPLCVRYGAFKRAHPQSLARYF